MGLEERLGEETRRGEVRRVERRGVQERRRDGSRRGHVKVKGK